MPILCVCCDLSDAPAAGGHTATDLRSMLPAVSDVVAGFGSCLRVAPATWLVETQQTADTVMEQLWQQVFAERERVSPQADEDLRVSSTCGLTLTLARRHLLIEIG